MTAIRVLLVSLCVCMLPHEVAAKDNTRHLLGIGFQRHPNPVGGPEALLSAKVAASPTVEIAVLAGLTVAEGSFAVTAGGKALYVLVPEESLNVYIAATGLPTVGSSGAHRFDWFAGPGLAYYPEWARHLEVFAEFGFFGTAPLTAERGPGVVGNRPLYVTTGGGIAVGLHYWF